MPLLRGETLRELVDRHHRAGNAVTVLTARGDAAGYGRIVRDDDGAFLRIVEERDATPEERAIDEYNSGCYAFDGTLLADAIKRVTTDNEQQQEYLTDVVDILRGDGHQVGTMLAADAGEITGVNDRRAAGAGPAGAQRPDTRRLDAGRGHRSSTPRPPGSTSRSRSARTPRSARRPSSRAPPSSARAPRSGRAACSRTPSSARTPSCCTPSAGRPRSGPGPRWARSRTCGRAPASPRTRTSAPTWS